MATRVKKCSGETTPLVSLSARMMAVMILPTTIIIPLRLRIPLRNPSVRRLRQSEESIHNFPDYSIKKGL